MMTIQQIDYPITGYPLFEPEEKNLIYILTLEEYNKMLIRLDYKPFTGICYSMSLAIKKEFDYPLAVVKEMVYLRAKVYFPEFLAKKPQNSRQYWWPEREYEPRLKILKELIKETS